MTLTLGKLSYDTTQLSEGYVTTVYADDKALFDITGPDAPQIAAVVVAALNEQEELHERLLLIAELAKPQSRDISGLCDTLQDICVLALKPPVSNRAVLDRARKGEG